jgi:hypothetical protein
MHLWVAAMADMLLGAAQGRDIRRVLITAGEFHIKSPCRQQANAICNRTLSSSRWRYSLRGLGARLLHSQAPWGSSAVFPCWPWPQRHVSDHRPANDASASDIADYRQSSRQHGHSRRQRSCTRTQQRASSLIHGPSQRHLRRGHGPSVPPCHRMLSQRTLQSSSVT